MQLSFFIYYKLNTDRIAIHATNANIINHFLNDIFSLNTIVDIITVIIIEHDVIVVIIDKFPVTKLNLYNIIIIDSSTSIPRTIFIFLNFFIFK